MACPPPEIDWSSWATWSCLREDIAPIATFVGAAIVALAALAQARTARRRHQEQTAADRERRITESFAKAVEQLGSDKLETRLGAIYTLERISKESEREYWPIMETLTAFVREHAPWPPRPRQTENGTDGKGTPPVEEPAQIRPATDIQAILTVLGRRDERVRKQDEAAGRCLNLVETDLRGAALGETHLDRAYLLVAHLEGADFWGAHLAGADLLGAHLQGTALGEAHLEGADLREAHLEGAYFGEAHLDGADLRGAAGLTQKQLDMAYGDDRTILPEGQDLKRPAHWPATASEKGPDEPHNAWWQL